MTLGLDTTGSTNIQVQSHDVINAETNVASQDAPLRTGWLYKRGGPTRAWKRRWFVLRKDHFAYYDDSNEYETRQIIQNDTISGISIKKEGKRPSISLYVGSREVQLRSDDIDDASSWVQALKSAVKLETVPHTAVTSPVDIVPKSSVKGALFTRRGGMPLSTSVQFANSVDSSQFVSPPLMSTSGSIMFSDDDYASPGQSDMSAPEDDVSPVSDTSPVRKSNKSVSGNPTDKVVVQGYLTRHHLSKPKRSAKVWAVLRSQGLSLYPDHNEYRPLKVISFKEIIDASELDEEAGNRESKKDKRWKFQVITKSKALRFSVDREELLDGWVGGLKSRLEQEELKAK